MAKLSADDNSWRASGLRKKYAEYEDVPSRCGEPKKKGDSKRWCKGKIGREHKLVLCRPKYFYDPYSCWDGLYLVCTKRHDQEHQRYHHMNKTYRCASCGKYVGDMAEEVRALVDPKLAEMLELEKKWCDKGHLWDWIGEQRPHNYYYDWRDWPYWRGSRYEYKTCVMCGRRAKGKGSYRVVDE